MGITGAIGVALVVLYAAVGHREALRSHAHHALVGLGTGAGVAAVLLAYPVWFALAGPAHLSGPIWGSLYLGVGGTALPPYVRATPASPSFTHLTHQVGGYQGPTLSGQYLGIALVAVLAIGALVLAARPEDLAVRGRGAPDRGAVPGHQDAVLGPLAGAGAPPARPEHHPQSVRGHDLPGRRRAPRGHRRPHPHRRRRPDRGWRRDPAVDGRRRRHRGGPGGAGPHRRLPVPHPADDRPAGGAPPLVQRGGTPPAAGSGGPRLSVAVHGAAELHDLAGRRPDALLDGGRRGARWALVPGRSREAGAGGGLRGLDSAASRTPTPGRRTSMPCAAPWRAGV